jgi:glutamate-5-semialdehyde dehydrogenase
MITSFERQLRAAKLASQELALLSTRKKNGILLSIALKLKQEEKAILRANLRDVQAMSPSDPKTDRLQLTPARLNAIIAGIRAVVRLPDPVGEVLDSTVRPNGLHIQRMRVPFGVIGVIYESRPNVTVDIACLTLKTGNAAVLKGGEEVLHSNTILIQIIRSVLKKDGVSPDAVIMVDPMKPALVEQLLCANAVLDVLIPRGSHRLIQFVREHATVPVIETGAGVCHTYVEKSANLKQAVDVVVNAKTRRVSVCNALDTIVVDASIARRFLSALAPTFAVSGVVVHADPRSFSILQSHYPTELLAKAVAEDFGREFLSMACSVKVVPNSDAALEFIRTHTSHHSESIVTENKKTAERFVQEIDAAAVYVNAPTSFTDGFEFGLGAEVGISTQKLHARGPMGLRELTSYKWIIHGAGQTRP